MSPSRNGGEGQKLFGGRADVGLNKDFKAAIINMSK